MQADKIGNSHYVYSSAQKDCIMAKKRRKPLKLEYIPRKTNRYNHPAIKRIYREQGEEANNIIHTLDRLDDYILEHGGYVKYDNMLLKKMSASMCKSVEQIKSWIAPLLQYDLYDQRCLKDNILTSYDMQISLGELGLRLRHSSLSIPYAYLLVPMDERMSLHLAPSVESKDCVKQYREVDYANLFHSEADEESVQCKIDDKCPYLKW